VRLFPLVVGLVLTAMAFDLARALATHDGVGPAEWLIGLGLVAALAAMAFGSLRRSFRS
jgi:uncharacterized membrane protein